jgi:hypothetical protein
LVAVGAVAGKPLPPFVVGVKGASDNEDRGDDEKNLHKESGQ